MLNCRAAAVWLAAAVYATAGTTSADRAASASAWCSYRYDEFEILTDLDPGRRTHLVQRLQHLPDLLESVYVPAHPAPPPVTRAPTFIVFASQQTFTRVADADHFAGFMAPELNGNRILLGAGYRGDDLTRAGLHEYAHHLVRADSSASLPLWFEEGLASVLAHARWRSDHAELGGLPSAVAGQAAGRSASHIRAVVGARSIDDMSARDLERFYATSWLLADYLLLDSNVVDELRRYLAAGSGLTQGDGLFRALGTTPARLYRRLRTYAGRTAGRRRVALQDRPAQAPMIGCLEDDEVRYRMAEAVTRLNGSWARSELEALVERHPDRPRYQVQLAATLNGLGDEGGARVLLEAVQRQHPDDTGALIARGNLLINSCISRLADECADRWQQAEQAFRRALDNNPERLDAAYGLGVTYLFLGLPGNGLNFLRAVYRQVPWDGRVNYFLGEGYRMLGDERAIGHLTNAYRWSDDAYWRARSRAALRRLGAD